MEISKTGDPATSFTVTPLWVYCHLDQIQKVDSPMQLLKINKKPETDLQGHIPGAVAINWDRELSQTSETHHIKKERFEEIMSSCGVTEDTTIILYGDENNWYAYHAFWVCWYFGHEKLYLMSGGRSQWKREGFEFTTEVPSVTETTYAAKYGDEKLDCGIIETT